MPKLQDTVIKKYNPSDVEAQKIKRAWIKTKKKYNKKTQRKNLLKKIKLIMMKIKKKKQ